MVDRTLLSRGRNDSTSATGANMRKMVSENPMAISSAALHMQRYDWDRLKSNHCFGSSGSITLISDGYMALCKYIASIDPPGAATQAC